jgi:hypothetical protein
MKASLGERPFFLENLLQRNRVLANPISQLQDSCRFHRLGSTLFSSFIHKLQLNMATIINNPDKGGGGDSGATAVIIILAVLIIGALFYYGFPGRRAVDTESDVNVPDEIDVNVNPPAGGTGGGTDGGGTGGGTGGGGTGGSAAPQ